MSFRTILSVAGIDRGDRDIALAQELAESVGAHLAVLVVSLAAPPPIGEYAAMVSDAWMQERQADLARLAARVGEVKELLGRAGGSFDVDGAYPEIAWADAVIGQRGRYADLTVIGPELLAGDTLKAKAFEGALFSSGRPVMLVPEGAAASLGPKTVLVGWDSRIEAARAVREALEILVGAEKVHLALVDPEESDGGHGAEPGADAATWLSRHGARVVVDRLPSMGRTAAETLRRHAADTGAGLLVIGGYGHSRLRERIFGGVTRAMLDDTPLPILLAR